MQDYHTLSQAFLQQKQFLGYRYKTEEIVLKEIVTFLNDREITKEMDPRAFITLIDRELGASNGQK